MVSQYTSDSESNGWSSSSSRSGARTVLSKMKSLKRSILYSGDFVKYISIFVLLTTFAVWWTRPTKVYGQIKLHPKDIRTSLGSALLSDSLAPVATNSKGVPFGQKPVLTDEDADLETYDEEDDEDEGLDMYNEKEDYDVDEYGDEDEEDTSEDANTTTDEYDVEYTDNRMINGKDDKEYNDEEVDRHAENGPDSQERNAPNRNNDEEDEKMGIVDPKVLAKPEDITGGDENERETQIRANPVVNIDLAQLKPEKLVESEMKRLEESLEPPAKDSRKGVRIVQEEAEEHPVHRVAVPTNDQEVVKKTVENSKENDMDDERSVQRIKDDERSVQRMKDDGEEVSSRLKIDPHQPVHHAIADERPSNKLVESEEEIDTRGFVHTGDKHTFARVQSKGDEEPKLPSKEDGGIAARRVNAQPEGKKPSDADKEPNDEEGNPSLNNLGSKELVMAKKFKDPQEGNFENMEPMVGKMVPGASDEGEQDPNLLGNKYKRETNTKTQKARDDQAGDKVDRIPADLREERLAQFQQWEKELRNKFRQRVMRAKQRNDEAQQLPEVNQEKPGEAKVEHNLEREAEKQVQNEEVLEVKSAPEMKNAETLKAKVKQDPVQQHDAQEVPKEVNDERQVLDDRPQAPNAFPKPKVPIPADVERDEAVLQIAEPKAQINPPPEVVEDPKPVSQINPAPEVVQDPKPVPHELSQFKASLVKMQKDEAIQRRVKETNMKMREADQRADPNNEEM